MRAKHILNRLPYGSKIRIVYDRITLTPCTTTYFFLALAHCLTQIVLQSVAFATNSGAGHTVSDILNDAEVTHKFAFVKDASLRVCDGIPRGGIDPCVIVAGVGLPSNFSSRSTELSGRPLEAKLPRIARRNTRIEVEPQFDESGSLVGVNVIGLVEGNHDEVVNLTSRCLDALSFPDILLHDARREDVVFLTFQFWLLGISVVTILNESIPHLVAVLATHCLSSGWSAFQVTRTHRLDVMFKDLVVDDACDGINVLPTFWSKRGIFLIPILVLNFVALVLTSGISWKLFGIYGRQTFKRVGASIEMNNMYKVVLVFSVCLQLSAFFTIASSGLWIDTLCTSVIIRYSKHKILYRAIFICTCVLVLPWIVAGWNCIRMESRWLTIGFLVVGTAITAVWTSMFASELYRWTFQNFPFFATMTITSFALLIATTLLAVLCRLNFGKGLPQYLETKEEFDFSSFVTVTLPRNSKGGSDLEADEISTALRSGPTNLYRTESLDEKKIIPDDGDGRTSDVTDLKNLDAVFIVPKGSRESRSRIPHLSVASGLSKFRFSFTTLSRDVRSPPHPHQEEIPVPVINIIPSSAPTKGLLTSVAGFPDGRDTRKGENNGERSGDDRDLRKFSTRLVLGDKPGLPTNPKAAKPLSSKGGDHV